MPGVLGFYQGHLAKFSYRSLFSLTERRSNYEATIGVKLVFTTRHAKAVFAEIVFPNFTIIADSFNSPVGPFFSEPNFIAEFTGFSEKTVDERVYRTVAHFVNIFTGNAQLFRGDECVENAGAIIHH